MRNSYGYSSYRGRSGIKVVLTVLAVVLLVLLLLLVGFFFFAQRYVVYYDDGSVHFEFPWTTQAEPTPTPAPTPSQALVVETPEPTPTPEPVILPLPVELPLTSLTQGTAQAEVAAAGGNAALFLMKNEKGHLAYASEQPWAKYAKVTETDPAVNEAITAALAEDGLYAIARVSCFRDDDTPYYYGRSNGLRTAKGNGNWRDETGSRWFSPAAKGTRDYLTDICLELCALGFDEIWLDNCTFPTAGKLKNILRNDNYDDADLAADLEGFYAQLSAALADAYPEVKLSLTVSPTLLSGAETNPSGQTVEQVKAYAHRIYLTPAPEGSDYAAALEELGFPEEDVVYFGGEALPEGAGQVITPAP